MKTRRQFIEQLNLLNTPSQVLGLEEFNKLTSAIETSGNYEKAEEYVTLFTNMEKFGKAVEVLKEKVTEVISVHHLEQSYAAALQLIAKIVNSSSNVFDEKTSLRIADVSQVAKATSEFLENPLDPEKLAEMNKASERLSNFRFVGYGALKAAAILLAGSIAVVACLMFASAAITFAGSTSFLLPLAIRLTRFTLGVVAAMLSVWAGLGAGLATLAAAVNVEMEPKQVTTLKAGLGFFAKFPSDYYITPEQPLALEANNLSFNSPL
jgi:hypothetical protein